MKAPDKIYVEVRHPFGNEFTEMLGFESRGNSDDVEYIRKDFLLELLEGKKKHYMDRQEYDCGWNDLLDELIDKLNSL